MEEAENSFLLACPFKFLCAASASSALAALGVFLLLT